MRVVALLIALGVAGCGPKAGPARPAGEGATTAAPTAAAEPASAPVTPRPTPSDAELERLFAASLDLSDALTTAIAASGTDCPAMAVALERVLVEHQPLIDELNAYVGNAEVDDRVEAFVAAHQDRLAANDQKARPGIEACADDPGVHAVLERFGDP